MSQTVLPRDRIALARLRAQSLPHRPQRTEPVDLLLVLAADVSRSVDSQKFQLQREGYAAALVNPACLMRNPIGPARPHRRTVPLSGRDSATRRS